jgi:broad specificity phosphatase PhoE
MTLAIAAVSMPLRAIGVSTAIGQMQLTWMPRSPSEIPDEDLEEAFLSAFRGIPPSDATFLGGETIGSLAERVGAAMNRLYADDWHTILVVMHGHVNRAVLSWAIGGPGTFFGDSSSHPPASTSSTATRRASLCEP